MSWYKTGVVTVTNGGTAVTATGTKFASNVRVGDGFNGPDGRWYEVVNIASETTLGIYPAYKGATESGSSTWMTAPIQGYNKETADRLRAITAGFGDITADVAAADASAKAAKLSETNAKTSETNAAASSQNATNYAVQSYNHSQVSLTESNKSQAAASTATTKAGEASASAAAAKTSETNAANSLANLQKTQSSTDVTAGRILKVGDYGFGVPITITDANLAVGVNGANYRLGSPYTNGPSASPYTITSYMYDSEVTQVAYLEGSATPTIFIRKRSSGTWYPWTRSLLDLDVVNNLTTSSTNAPLSARQGQILNSSIGYLDSKIGNAPTQYSGSLDVVDTINSGFTVATVNNGGTKPPNKSYGFLQQISQGTGASAQTRQYWNDFDGTPGTKSTWVRDKYGTGTWGAWRTVYDQNSVIGTVANVTAGPTESGIVERGSNVNGDYTKFIDGTMFAWKRQSGSTNNSYAQPGGYFAGDAVASTTPVAFVGIPSVQCSVGGGVGNAGIALASCYALPTASSFGSWRVFTDSATVIGNGVVFSFFAVGRWR